MPITPRGNSWLVTVGSGPGRYRQSFKDEGVARAVLASEEAKRAKKALAATQPLTPQHAQIAAPRPLAGPAIEAPAGSVTLGYVFKIAKATQWHGKGKAQVKNAQQVIDALGERTPIASIKQEQVRNLTIHFINQGNSGGTVNKKMSALSVLLKLAADEGWITQMPRIKRRPENEHNTKFFEVEEVDRMLALCDKYGMLELADLIAFGIDTGFRRANILGVSVDACRDGKGRLTGKQTKQKRGLVVPLTDRVKAIVERRAKLGYSRVFEDLTENKLRRMWAILRDAMGAAEDPEFIVHTLRHTCGTRLALAGKSAPFIMAWLGHSNITVTQRYINLAGKGLESGTDALDSFTKVAGKFNQGEAPVLDEPYDGTDVDSEDGDDDCANSGSIPGLDRVGSVSQFSLSH